MPLDLPTFTSEKQTTKLPLPTQIFPQSKKSSTRLTTRIADTKNIVRPTIFKPESLLHYHNHKMASNFIDDSKKFNQTFKNLPKKLNKLGKAGLQNFLESEFQQNENPENFELPEYVKTACKLYDQMSEHSVYSAGTDSDSDASYYAGNLKTLQSAINTDWEPVDLSLCENLENNLNLQPETSSLLEKYGHITDEIDLFAQHDLSSSSDDSAYLPSSEDDFKNARILLDRLKKTGRKRTWPLDELNGRSSTEPENTPGTSIFGTDGSTNLTPNEPEMALNTSEAEPEIPATPRATIEPQSETETQPLASPSISGIPQPTSSPRPSTGTLTKTININLDASNILPFDPANFAEIDQRVEANLMTVESAVESKYFCKICREQEIQHQYPLFSDFDTKSRCRSHIKQAHYWRIACTICNRIFNTYHSVHGHLRTKHQLMVSMAEVKNFELIVAKMQEYKILHKIPDKNRRLLTENVRSRAGSSSSSNWQLGVTLSNSGYQTPISETDLEAENLSPVEKISENISEEFKEKISQNIGNDVEPASNLIKFYCKICRENVEQIRNRSKSLSGSGNQGPQDFYELDKNEMVRHVKKHLENLDQSEEGLDTEHVKLEQATSETLEEETSYSISETTPEPVENAPDYITFLGTCDQETNFTLKAASRIRKIKVYWCALCKFKIYTSWQNHVRSHEASNKFKSLEGSLKCNYCDFYFSERARLNHHMQKHQESKSDKNDMNSSKITTKNPKISDKSSEISDREERYNAGSNSNTKERPDYIKLVRREIINGKYNSFFHCELCDIDIKAWGMHEKAHPRNDETKRLANSGEGSEI